MDVQEHPRQALNYNRGLDQENESSAQVDDVQSDRFETMDESEGKITFFAHISI